MNMKNELRLGNYVTVDATLQTVIGIYSNGIETENYSVLDELAEHNELKAIPLTEEWLERFGFKEEDGLWSNKGKNEPYIFPAIKYLPKWYPERGKERDGCFTLKIDFLSPKILYVHNLQNLYHALTGEELKPSE